jgi:hypothetical protein
MSKNGVNELEPIFAMEPVRSDTIPTGEDWIAQVKWDGVPTHSGFVLKRR